MITIFTVPRIFRDHFALIQRNAISSWKRLLPRCEVILFGDDDGVVEAARDLGVSHAPDIKKNEFGTPLINDIFEKAQKFANNDILAYVNADIILTNDFTEAWGRVGEDKCLVVGRRWDVDINEPINFENAGWGKELKEKIAGEGKLHGSSGIDYFIFKKGLFDDIPPFALGRTSWDNWFLYNAWSRGASLIDATGAITAVHQNHNYSHHSKGTVGVWKGPEAKINFKLAGGYSHFLTVRDASHILTVSGLRKPRLTVYRFFSFPFRYFVRVPLFFKIFLFPGWFGMVLSRAIKGSIIFFRIPRSSGGPTAITYRQFK